MQTLTIQVTHKNAIKALHLLEKQQFIKIIDDAGLHSPALPGVPFSLDAFKSWINDTEKSDMLSLIEAKQKWAGKRKKILFFT